MNYYFLLLLVLVGCAPQAREVEISIFNRTEVALTDVRVISGGDKVYLKRVDAGTKKDVTLDPGQTSDYQVTLFYRLLDHRVVWNSDPLPMGNDYSVDISISQEGAKAHHCIQPCE